MVKHSKKAKMGASNGSYQPERRDSESSSIFGELFPHAGRQSQGPVSRVSMGSCEVDAVGCENGRASDVTSVVLFVMDSTRPYNGSLVSTTRSGSFNVGFPAGKVLLKFQLYEDGVWSQADGETPRQIGPLSLIGTAVVDLQQLLNSVGSVEYRVTPIGLHPRKGMSVLVTLRGTVIQPASASPTPDSSTFSTPRPIHIESSEQRAEQYGSTGDWQQQLNPTDSPNSIAFSIDSHASYEPRAPSTRSRRLKAQAPKSIRKVQAQKQNRNTSPMRGKLRRPKATKGVLRKPKAVEALAATAPEEASKPKKTPKKVVVEPWKKKPFAPKNLATSTTGSAGPKKAGDMKALENELQTMREEMKKVQSQLRELTENGTLASPSKASAPSAAVEEDPAGGNPMHKDNADQTETEGGEEELQTIRPIRVVTRLSTDKTAAEVEGADEIEQAPKASEAEPAPEPELAPEAPVIVLDSEEEMKVVKIQAMVRGKADRTKVDKQNAEAAAAAESITLNSEEEEYGDDYEKEEKLEPEVASDNYDDDVEEIDEVAANAQKDEASQQAEEEDRKVPEETEEETAEAAQKAELDALIKMAREEKAEREQVMQKAEEERRAEVDRKVTDAIQAKTAKDEKLKEEAEREQVEQKAEEERRAEVDRKAVEAIEANKSEEEKDFEIQMAVVKKQKEEREAQEREAEEKNEREKEERNERERADREAREKEEEARLASTNVEECADCDERVATVRCQDCDDFYCAKCDAAMHRGRHASHFRSALPGVATAQADTSEQEKQAQEATAAAFDVQEAAEQETQAEEARKAEEQKTQASEQVEQRLQALRQEKLENQAREEAERADHAQEIARKQERVQQAMERAKQMREEEEQATREAQVGSGTASIIEEDEEEEEGDEAEQRLQIVAEVVDETPVEKGEQETQEVVVVAEMMPEAEVVKQEMLEVAAVKQELPGVAAVKQELPELESEPEFLDDVRSNASFSLVSALLLYPGLTIDSLCNSNTPPQEGSDVDASINMSANESD
jgi:hypothetical protein